jgi:SAM-dependent methyltransferase
MRRTTCGACGSSDLDLILDLGSSPLADDFPATAEAARTAQRYPLQLFVCTSCWLVQLGEIVPDELLWGGDYGFYTGASPSLRTHFEDYARWLKSDGLLPGKGEVAIEVASNDGTLLQHLGDAGAYAIGVEPAKGPAEAARSAGLEVVGAPFGLATAEQLRSVCQPAMLIVANNVLAHVADLDDFLAGVRTALHPAGVFVLEVQYLADLVLGNEFDHVYHEHRSFFSIGPLAKLLEKHGLPARQVIRQETQGGSIRLVCGPAFGGLRWVEKHEAWLRDPTTYASLQARADRISDRLNDLLAEEAGQGREIVGIAASAKSCTLLNWCAINPASPGLDWGVSRIYDRTPAKNGRFAPGSGIPITTDPLPPGKDVSALVMAHNYLPGLIRRESGFLAEGGRFVVPIPQPVVI